MTESEATGIGFVGLGRMGEPMVGRLLRAGHVVSGYDAAAEAGAALAARPGFARADSVVALASSPTLILMLPSSEAVDAVLRGDGLLERLQPGTTVIDMGSSDPRRTRELAERVDAQGSTLLDAPVSGGVAGAREGHLTIMVGGPAEAVERALPIFEALGTKVTRIGEVGAGHALKALNNLMSATHLLISSEALVAARAFGIDLDLALEAINGSSGRSASTEQKWPSFVLPETYDSGFGIELMVKDMRVALALADHLGTPDELGRRSLELWAEAAEQLPADADHTEIARLLAAAAARKRGQ